MRKPKKSLHCIPCETGAKALNAAEQTSLIADLPGWRSIDGHHLERTLEFPDFMSALHAVNKIGAIAEVEGHHPDLFLSWGKVIIKIWTHAINGLSENDFILAAQLEAELGEG